MTAGGQVQMSAPMPRRFDDVNRMAAAGHEHFGGELVVVVDLDDLANQLHAVGRHVVQPADERADERRAGLGGEQRLRRREDQRDVDAEPLARQRLARPNAVARQRHLDHHVLVDRGDVVPFAHHAREVGRDDLAADRPLDDVADLLQVLAVVARLLRQQRRVGRHAVDDADERRASRCP